MKIQDDALILFQGDSITDASRDRTATMVTGEPMTLGSPPPVMGHGYANMVAAWLNASMSEKGLHFLNRGIAGDKITDLRDRWQRDCIDHKPDWVSVMIGINDTVHGFNAGDDAFDRAYEETYPALLTRVRDELGARLIIIEPFLLPVHEHQHEWRTILDHKITVSRQMARAFDAIYVPVDGVFGALSLKRPMAEWLSDGVHPTQAGHMVIARQWLRAVGAL